MTNNNYKTVPKESNPMKYGSTPQSNAQGMSIARQQRQHESNMRYKGKGGRVPKNYGISPDSPAQGYSPFPTFQTAGLSSQNSNSASKNGNTNVAVGNENQKYDICATSPTSPVCAGTGITISAPKPKSGGNKRAYKRRNKKTTKKRSLKRKSKRRKQRKTKRRTKSRTKSRTKRTNRH